MEQISWGNIEMKTTVGSYLFAKLFANKAEKHKLKFVIKLILECQLDSERTKSLLLLR